MMQCNDIDELMVDFLYQELDGAQLLAWNAHVSGCDRCGAEIQSLQRTRQALRALPEAEPSSSVTTRLLHEAGKRAARVKAAEGVGFFEWLHRLVGPVMAHPAWAAAASLLIVVGVAGFLSMRGKVSKNAQQLDETTTATVPAEAPPIHDRFAAAGSAPAAATAPVAPATTVAADEDAKARPEAAEVKIKASPAKDVRAVGSPAPEYSPKVPAPAVVSTPPAKKLRDLGYSVGEENRTGRTASPGENEDVQLARKPASEAPAQPSNQAGQGQGNSKATGQAKADSADDFGGVAAAPPAPADQPDPTPAPSAEPQAPADRERSQVTPDVKEEARNDSRSNVKAPAPAPSAGRPLAKEAPPASPPPPPPEPAKGARSEQASGPGAPGGDSVTGVAVTEAQAQGQPKSAAKEPPEQELLKLSQKQAGAGRCDDALGTRQKIQRMNPEFYRKRVAGDPGYKVCEAQSKQRRAAPARQKESVQPDEKAGEVTK